MSLRNPGRWIPAFAGVTALLAANTFAADNLLGGKKPEFLPVDLAFDLQPLLLKDHSVEVSWRIAKDYYLYQDKLKFTLVAPAALKLGAPALPAALAHEDEHFGTTKIYRDKVVVTLPFTGDAKAVRLTVNYQGCADAGLCYPPQTRTLGTDD